LLCERNYIEERQWELAIAPSTSGQPESLRRKATNGAKGAAESPGSLKYVRKGKVLTNGSLRSDPNSATNAMALAKGLNSDIARDIRVREAAHVHWIEEVCWCDDVGRFTVWL
jgi:hypothetical protein